MQQQPAAQASNTGTSYTYKSTASNTAASGINANSIKRVLTQPDGILLAIVWLFSLIAFASMTDWKGWKDRNTSAADAVDYDASPFEYLVAIGVMAWLWSMACFVFLLLDMNNTTQWFSMAEFGINALLAFLSFVAGLASSAHCDKEIATGAGDYCEDEDNPKAANAFTFLYCFLLMGSTFFSYQKWKRPA